MANLNLENSSLEKGHPQVGAGAIGRKPTINLGTKGKKAPSKQPAAGASVASHFTGKRLYTLKEAAHYLGRSESGMRDLIWAGKIPVVREEGGRKIFIDVHDLIAYVELNKAVYH